jgi:hypothetical protein
MKTRKRFPTIQAEIALAEYKASPSEDTLDNLYNQIDPIVLEVTSRISFSFKHKHPDDFLDIQQNVRLSIYRILKRLADISVTGNQVISVVIKATVWSLKTHYRRYKKVTPVMQSAAHGKWLPEFEIAIEVPISEIIPIFDMTERQEYNTPDYWTGESKHPRYNSQYEDVGLWHNSGQFHYAFLRSLPDLVMKKVLELNRFKEEESLIRFCVMSFFDNRTPSTILIAQRWRVSDAFFWPRYAEVILKLAMLDVLAP